MREIKFRGKFLCTGEWVYGDLIHKRHDRGDVMIQDEKGCGWDVDPETVGQYTGLKDANGVEIYDGDILYYRSMSGCEKRKVVFREAAFFLETMNGYSLGPVSSFTEYSDGPLWYNSKEKLYLHTVTGNIHDKKE